jgi:hypothetical protein
MRYLGNNIFRLTAWDKAKRVISGIYYPLCAIPYVYLLTNQPFRCIVFSFFISLIGVFILFILWRKESGMRMVWAIYLAFAPGFIMFILAPFLLLQKISDIIQNSP